MAIPITKIMTGDVQNIIDCYESATESQQMAGENWYWMARHLAEELADRHDLPVENVAYAIAALSPVTDWITNQIAASEVCATGFTRFQSGANIHKANRCLAGELTALRGPKSNGSHWR